MCILQLRLLLDRCFWMAECFYCSRGQTWAWNSSMCAAHNKFLVPINSMLASSLAQLLICLAWINSTSLWPKSYNKVRSVKCVKSEFKWVSKPVLISIFSHSKKNLFLRFEFFTLWHHFSFIIEVKTQLMAACFCSFTFTNSFAALPISLHNYRCYELLEILNLESC